MFVKTQQNTRSTGAVITVTAIDAVFFRWVQTSVRFSGSGSQKVLGKLGLILKLRGVKSAHHFFS